MSFASKENDNDNDIHVISRDTNDFAHPEHMDTPSFIQSLDLPTPTNNLLFDNFNPDLESQLHNDQLSANNAHSFQDSPSLAPLTDFVSHDVQLQKDFQPEHQTSYTGALTKLDHLLPPLPQLSEPVIPPNLQLQNHASLPEYLQGNTSISNRPQPLLLAGKRKKETQVPKTRPAFVMKIWSMVNDPNNHDNIRWNEDGETFQVVHREEFMKNILPKYFKHNNFASFVRQLNMYGWHKIQDINSGSMKDDRNQEEVLQFKNPYFIRGREDLLDNIVRNKTGGNEDTLDVNLLNLQYVMNEIDLIKMNQLAILEDMRRMRKDNQVLWSESFTARDRHQKQSQTLEKIMKFLAAVYGNSAGKIFEVEDNNFSNQQVSAYNNTTAKPSFASPGPAPVSKPRLMLMDQAYRRTSASTSKSPSMASIGKDSVEEITRNTPQFQNTPESSANANRIYQQIMNPESAGVSSPGQFFPELSGSFLNTNQRQHENSSGAHHQQEEQLQGLEDNIVKQGQALLQVQDWIQALASRQQQQQEQIHQQQQNQRSPGNLPADGNLDDFDVDEFLDNGSLNIQHQASAPHGNPIAPEYLAGKRVIEQVENDNIQRSKRKRI
ncbi:hypothetical protein METBIDRAFT_33655 [Metschnikowia bicuspidata var. bicuspidata NRRL YB-4993]|uniref:Heat shock transcription factor n=1 Tax=Metschnikowia bicuspidata var. bicuspidata NRRL YB-4993 TaxID=869754 RepID=A0A1A0H4N1_9ASCO|nr:hypothetical protein METBIDRAFT_33655 [Metschnikowia bicuspidata var. bicuspidata NRRL YB-4993]OBA19034.1 hypothetical protein METBIDRAFT_33655 [Metschnikowia bicuspidata var. bicuspidata NRRL YB-4993]